MEGAGPRVLRQPHVGLAAAVLASLTLIFCWRTVPAFGAAERPSLFTWVLVAGLMAAMPVAYRFPMYLRHNTKVCVATIPPFLLAAALSPPLAASSIAIGVVAGEWSVRSQNGSEWSDITTHVARLMLVGTAGSLAVHAVRGGTVEHVVLLVTAACIWWLGDFLTLPLVLTPISGEAPLAIIRTTIREGGLIEAGQYVVGVLGAALVLPRPWTAILLVGPAVLIYLLSRKEVDADTYRLLETMADAVDLRDPFTVGHSRQVAELTGHILDALGRHGQEAALIRLAARVHDIGKVTIPDQVFLNRSEPTEGERTMLRDHAQRGADILGNYPDLARLVEMVRHHHERWDGTGYPDGLRGAEIPFGARVVAVADSFQTMTSDRPRRGGLPLPEAVEALRTGAGRQWDPDIVGALLRLPASVSTRREGSQPDPVPAESVEGLLYPMEA